MDVNFAASMRKRGVFGLLFLLIQCLCTWAQMPVSGISEENTDRNQKILHYNLYQMSEKLRIPFDSAYNTEILLTGCEWVGVPYQYGMCSKNGTDCSGFAQYLYRRVYQLELVHSSAGIYQQCKPVKKADLEHGDLLFFKIYKNRISHVGVYLGHGYFIHASVQRGVIISHLEEDYYRRTYFSGGRILQVEQ